MSRSSEESEQEEEEEEEEEEDDLTTLSRPRWVRGVSDFSDFEFHPSNYNLAAGDMDGYLNIFKVSPGEESEDILMKKLSKKPLRCVAHTSDGSGLFVASKMGSIRIFDTESEQISQVLMEKESPSYCLCVINQNLIASGDDAGTLKVWDVRKGSSPIIEEDRSHDFISCLSTDKHGKFLFATSGDGTMSTYNVKRRKFLVQSENAEYDMTCVSVVKNNKKVVVGTSNGLMLLYNWEEFAAPSDRFPGHPAPIECLGRINEEVIVTGSMDGMIRAVHILPNRFLGVVGEHKGMAVSKISVCHDKKFIASSSHDSVIKFWNTEHLQNTNVDANAKPQKDLKTKKLVKSGVSGDKFSFVSDLDKELKVPVVEGSDEEDSNDEISSNSESNNDDPDS